MTPERRYLPTSDYPDAIRVEKRDGEPTILTCMTSTSCNDGLSSHQVFAFNNALASAE